MPVTKRVNDLLPEVKRPRLGRRRLRKVVPVPEHRAPDVPVQVVHRAPRTDEQGLVPVKVLPQRPQRGAHGHVEVRVVHVVRADDGDGRAAGRVREHVDQDGVAVVDPVEPGVLSAGDAGGCQVGRDGGQEGEVWVQRVGFVLCWVDEDDWVFFWRGVGGEEDGGFGGAGPVCAL